jgi:predicted ATPase
MPGPRWGGVWFADLAPLGDPDPVAVTVADVLGVRQEPGQPVAGMVVERWAGGACWWCWTTASM